MPYTGDTRVQRTTAHFLTKQLGWRSVYAPVAHKRREH